MNARAIWRHSGGVPAGQSLGVAAYVYFSYGPAIEARAIAFRGSSTQLEPGRDSAPMVDPSVGPAPSLPAIESAGPNPVPGIGDETREPSPPPKELFIRHTGLDQDYGMLAACGHRQECCTKRSFDLRSCEGRAGSWQAGPVPHCCSSGHRRRTRGSSSTRGPWRWWPRCAWLDDTSRCHLWLADGR